MYDANQETSLFLLISLHQLDTNDLSTSLFNEDTLILHVILKV